MLIVSHSRSQTGIGDLLASAAGAEATAEASGGKAAGGEVGAVEEAAMAVEAKEKALFARVLGHTIHLGADQALVEGAVCGIDAPSIPA